MEAFDWNCPQHITPRFTEDQIQEVLAPMEARMQQLQQDNERLRDEFARLAQEQARSLVQGTFSA